MILTHFLINMQYIVPCPEMFVQQELMLTFGHTFAGIYKHIFSLTSCKYNGKGTKKCNSIIMYINI